MAKFSQEPERVTMNDVNRQIDTRLKSAAFWNDAPPRTINPSSISSSPLTVRLDPGAATDYTITNTTPRRLDGTDGYFDVSGERQVEVRITANVTTPTSNYVVISAMIDGAPKRVAQTNVSGDITLTGYYTAAPGVIAPGRRLFSVGAHVTGGTATVLTGPADTNYLEMSVREVY